MTVYLLWAAGTLPAQEGFQIRVDVALVTTDVTVIGTPVSELQKEDFVIYDNNVAQEITHFSRDQLPLAVALVIDRSLSVQKYMPMLQIAAVSALRRLKPEDQVALFAFDSYVERLNDLTEDRLLIADKIGKIRNKLGTNIYDAIHDAANYLKKNASRRRRAIILVSDNIRWGPSRYNAKKAREELLETASTLYGIRTPADFGPPGLHEENRRSFQETDAEVKRMAAETGGELFDLRAEKSLQAVLEKIVSNLRMQYTLGFNPSNPGKEGSFHKLAVRLAREERCPGCRLVTRSGYYSGVSAPLPSPPVASKSRQAATPKSEISLIQRNILIAASAAMELTDIPFTVNTAKQEDYGGQPQIRVDLQIYLNKIAFKTTEDRHACKMHVAVFYASPEGRLLGSDWRIIEGQVKPEKLSQAVNPVLSFSTAIPIKVPDQILKIVIYDEESDRVGSKLIRFP